MALVTSPLGTIKQSIDNLNFRTWKDKNVIARRVTTSNQPNTPSQVAQKNKFAAAVAISRALLPALRVGFKGLAKSMTEANVFMSQNLTKLVWNAVEGKFVDIAGLVISKGSLAGLANLRIASAEAGSYKLSWNVNTDGVSGMATDRLFVAILGMDSGKGLVLPTTATRSQGEYTIENLEMSFSSDTVLVCAFFVSADGRLVSDNSNVIRVIL